MTDYISPVECKHTRRLFIQSSRWTGIGDHGSEQVYVCPACGQFMIHASSNGQHVTVEFELCMPDQVEAAGKYLEYLWNQQAIQFGREARYILVQQQYDAGNLTKDEALELLRGPLSPDDMTTVYDDSDRLHSEG